jgi:hypothetical protein
MTPSRQVLGRRTFSNLEVEDMLTWLAQWRPFQIVVEATAHYEWFWQQMQGVADRIVLAHPGKLRVIAESTRKSDKIDAFVLAEFLALDMIPQAYRPTPRERAHRRLVRHCAKLRRRTTSVLVEFAPSWPTTTQIGRISSPCKAGHTWPSCK